MNMKLVWEMMRKDLQDIRQNGYVIYSVIFAPVILAIVGVLGTVATIGTLGTSVTQTGGISPITTFGSMFVLIPAIITTLIGSTSVTLEKNNKSLEPLLATPITDMEFFAGKALAPLVVGILVSYLSYAIYIGSVDAMTYGSLGYLLFPTDLTLIQMFFLVPVVGSLGTFASLLVSSRVKDVRSAQQLSTLVVLPLLILVYLPLFAAGEALLVNVLLGFALLAAALGVFVLSVKAFRRENVLTSWNT